MYTSLFIKHFFLIVTFIFIAALLTGCITSSQNRPDRLDQTHKGQDLSEQDLNFLDSLTRFNDKKLTAAKIDSKVEDPELVQAYVQAGITLSNQQCSIWLNQLSDAERASRLSQDLFNIVGNAILGIGAINGWDTNTLARGALGLAAGNSLIESYRQRIFQGIISNIIVELESGRSQMAGEILAFNRDTEDSNNIIYDEATRLLSKYHQSCSPEAISKLLNESLKESKYAQPEMELSSPINEAKKSVIRGQLYTIIFGGEGQISDDNVYKLFVIFSQSSSSSAQKLKEDSYVKLVQSKLANPPPEAFVLSLYEYAAISDFNQRFSEQESGLKAEAIAENNRTINAASSEINIREDQINSLYDSIESMNIELTFLNELKPITNNIVLYSQEERVIEEEINNEELISEFITERQNIINNYSSVVRFDDDLWVKILEDIDAPERQEDFSNLNIVSNQELSNLNLRSSELNQQISESNLIIANLQNRIDNLEVIVNDSTIMIETLQSIPLPVNKDLSVRGPEDIQFPQRVPRIYRD